MRNQLLPGFEERRVGAALVTARADVLPFVLDALHTSGTLYEFALQHSTERLSGGRGLVPVLDTPSGDRWAVRHYWRGGAVARVLGDRYLRFGLPRPVRELEMHSLLRARGVSTPPMVVAVVHEEGAWYRGDVATVLVPGASDLAELTLGPARWDEREREQAWFSAGALLRRLFTTGAEHEDLNLRNIIVQRETGEAYLLDLDACVLPDKPSGGAADRMLSRLHRSRHKLERLMGGTVSALELAALKRGRGS